MHHEGKRARRRGLDGDGNLPPGGGGLRLAVVAEPRRARRVGRLGPPRPGVSRVVRLIDRVGEEPESWPWILEEDFDRQIEVAAEVLGIPVAAVAEDSALLAALRIE